MEVDIEPSAGPSIPPWRTRQTSPKSVSLRRIYVNELRSTDQQLCGRLANLDEYRNNVKRFGEDIFIQLLRDTADKNNWKALFKHSTLYLYLTWMH